MRSGMKNVLVRIERITTTKSPETNADINTWCPIIETWCDTTARRGLEVPLGGQIVAMSYVRFDFDYLDVEDVIETDRIVLVDTGVIYAIKGILPDLSRKDIITIDAALERPPA